jgi:hypothetical protein
MKQRHLQQQQQQQAPSAPNLSSSAPVRFRLDFDVAAPCG